MWQRLLVIDSYYPAFSLYVVRPCKYVQKVVRFSGKKNTGSIQSLHKWISPYKKLSFVSIFKYYADAIVYILLHLFT